MKNNICDIIVLSIWGKGSCVADLDLFKEMRMHAIIALPTDVLSCLHISDSLGKKWENAIMQQMVYNTQYYYALRQIPTSIPYIILKGSAASKYYPNPQYRAMGDIDIMTRREDYSQMCNTLISCGYTEMPNEKSIRHRTFIKWNVPVEVHAYFASLNDPKQAEYLDNLIIENINSSHILPDMINGLVLLEHISQHLEKGLGLRQIIDWMMFVDKCLPDDKWNDFKTMASQVGLEKLAVVVTRMCEMFLGLPEREWCKDAKDNLCKELMEYVLSCGNFGNKKQSAEDISENVFAFASTPRMVFKLLQKRGLANWKVTEKITILKPFAWIYQAIRYISRGLSRDHATMKIREEYKIGKKRNKMFKELGVKIAANGISVLKEGKYIKEYH